MSCRKYEAPRHGSLAYCPKKRARSVKQSLRAFPRDSTDAQPHLTATFAYKVGMTHVIRVSERAKPGDKKLKSTKREVFDPVTLLEAPPVIIFGIVGYSKSITGMKRKAMLISEHISEGVVRRINKGYYANKNANVMSRLAARHADPSLIQDDIQALKGCEAIRVLIHSQCEKIKPLKTKKSHIMEVQVNGGKSVEEKVEWALNHLEKEIPVTQVFDGQECIDTIGVTKGKGFQGCPKRFGTRILPRKTNKGLRKVACIGAWHPSRVMWTVPRAGQLGFHRRTEVNKRIYKIGNGKDIIKTEFDLTEKTVNVMGSFPHYGNINNDYIMVKGSIMGPKKRVVTLRKSLFTKFTSKNTEDINIKFIDTSSKFGHGRFQTPEEKQAFYGATKKKVTEIAEQQE
ncbi:60S ribosomal protein L3 [Binucleata daphniae]